MDEQSTNSGDGDTDAATFSDEAIRRFLLCRLSDEERTRLEERLFVDDEMERRVRLAECEIADDYAFNRLSAEERRLFEERFAVTDERRQKLAVSQALRSHLSQPTLAAKKTPAAIENGPGWRERLQGLFAFDRPALAFAASLAAVVIVAGLVWFVTRNVRESGEPIIARSDPSPTPQASPQAIASPAPTADATPSPNPGVTPSPIPTPKTTPAIIEPPRAPVVASVLILPGALRDGGEMSRLILPKSGRGDVRLQLALEAHQPGTYRAELLTAEGQSVTASRKLRASGGGAARVVFDFPARLLQAGDYQVRLSRNAGGGASEDVGRYYFRALSQ